MQKIDKFTLAYIEAAIWTDLEDSEVDTSYPNFSPDTLHKMVADCKKFQEDNERLILDEYYQGSSQYDVAEYAGHDFWLTRNGHGAGFWDGDWFTPVGEQLTKAAKKFGEFHLYVGDDGMIYS